MATPNIFNNIFTYLFVRPPRAPSPKPTRPLVLKYDDSGVQPPVFYKLVEFKHRDDGRDRTNDEADCFLRSDECAFSRQQAALLQRIYALYDIFLKRCEPAEGAELRPRIERILGVTIDAFVESEAFRKAKMCLWDTFYSLAACPRATRKEYREEYRRLLAGIRAIALIERLALDDTFPNNASEFRHMQQAKPLLPSDLFPLPKSRSQERSDDPSATTRSPLDEIIKEKKRALWSKIVGLHKAQVELEQLDETFLSRADVPRNKSTGQDASIDRAEKTTGPVTRFAVKPVDQPQARVAAPPDRKIRVASAGADESDPWVLPDEELDKLSLEAKSALQEAGVSLSGRRVSTILDTVGSEISDAMARLFQRNRKAVEHRVDPKIARAAMLVSELPRGLEFGALDLDLISDEMLEQTRQPALPAEFDAYKAKGEFKQEYILGIGDYNVVRQTLLRYVPAEIAHVENILRSEHKERKHRRLHRTEETFTIEEERTEKTEKDQQSTERFELEHETQKTIQSDMSLEAGVSVTGQFGPVTVSTNVGFELSSSTEESDRTATSYARDVTERSLHSIQERVREQRIRKIVEEVEETNTHGFDNTQGPGHVTGIYRFLNQIWRAQVVNIGRRLMIEVVVPEPAAFYLYMQSNPKSEDEDKPPVAPECLEPPLKTPNDISEHNWLTFASAYDNVEGVKPPPSRWAYTSKSIQRPEMKDEGSALLFNTDDQLMVPDDYFARYAYVTFAGARNQDDRVVLITVGRATARFDLSAENNCDPGVYNHIDIPRIILGLPPILFGAQGAFTTLCMEEEDGAIPISISTEGYVNYSANIEILCKRKRKKLQAWQLNTYNAIVTAYREKKAAYDEKQRAAEIAAGVVITGRNPKRNQEIIEEELKKWCITRLTGVKIEGLNAMRTVTDGPPEIDNKEAILEGAQIQFFELLMEWNNMAYWFYPYFWGKKECWADIFPLDDPDPLFAKFLRAGSARVVVPVRPHYEDAFYHFYKYGEIWEGGDPPGIDDELYVSIVEELRGETDELNQGIPVPDSCWEFTVPTSLVYLQEDSTLPDFTEQAPAEGNEEEENGDEEGDDTE